jgi:hypothetical protein
MSRSSRQKMSSPDSAGVMGACASASAARLFRLSVAEVADQGGQVGGATVGGALATLVIGGCAGIYPAWRASRLSPTEALAAP